MKNFTEHFTSYKFLFIIVLIGFILRILPILWGVPIGPFVHSYHPDEPKVYEYIINFPHSYFSFNYFKGYGTSIQVILCLIFLPLKLIKVLGFPGLYEIIIIVLARFANVLFGTIAIFFTYMLGNRIFDKRAGVLSAAFYALAFYPVINSSVITLDVVMGTLIVLNFLITFLAVKTNSKESFIILGLAGGLLLGTKITGGLFLIVPFILALPFFRKNLQNEEHAKPSKGIFKNLLVYLLMVLIVFIILNPYAFLYPQKYLHFLLFQNDILIDRAAADIWKAPGYWFESNVISLGLPAAVLSLLGILFIRRKNLSLQFILVFFLIEYYLFWRWAMQPRYVISVAPILCIFAASFIFQIVRLKQTPLKILGNVIAAAAVCYSVCLCVFGILLRFNDTRTHSAEYIANNIKDGSSISYSYTSNKYPWRYHEWRYPKVDFKKYRYKDLLDNPDFIILSSYDFKKIEYILKSNKLNSNYELNEKYFDEWYMDSPPSPKLFQFYDSLLNNKGGKYSLVKIFKTDINVPIEFPPPEIRIYRKAR